MKKLFAFIIIAFIATTTFGQKTWKVDPMHSKLTFSITHLGISDVDGLFKTFNVTVRTTRVDFSDAVFNLSADVNSIDTEVEMRDNHLRSADFFNVEKYPKMTFASTSIKKSGKNRYKLTGNLTLHGITKSVTMDLWYRGTTVNPMGKVTTAGFQLTGKIKRSDFAIGPNFPAPMLSDVVSIKADGEFVPESLN